MLLLLPTSTLKPLILWHTDNQNRTSKKVTKYIARTH